MMLAQPEKQLNTFAIIGLIAAVCGLPLEFFPWKPPSWGYASFGLLIALLATASGIAACHFALAEIRKSPEHYKGRALAFVGLVIGYLSIAAYILMTLASRGIQP